MTTTCLHPSTPAYVRGQPTDKQPRERIISIAVDPNGRIARRNFYIGCGSRYPVVVRRAAASAHLRCIDVGMPFATRRASAKASIEWILKIVLGVFRQRRRIMATFK